MKRNVLFFNWGCYPKKPGGESEAKFSQYRLMKDAYQEKSLGLSDLWEEVEKTRALLAQLIGIPDHLDHIMFTTGTFDGLFIYLTYLTESGRLNREEEILTTNLEFPNLYRQLKSARDFKLRVVDCFTHKSASEITESIINACDESTKLAILSHVTYTGLLLPLEEICRELKRKNPRIIILSDGAQALGQVIVDLSRMLVDAYVADFHKWIQSPTGSGFLYVRDSVQFEEVAARSTCPLQISPRMFDALRSGDPFDSDSISGFNFPETAVAQYRLALFLTRDYQEEIGNSNRRLSLLLRGAIEDIAHRLRERISYHPCGEEGVMTGILSITSYSEYLYNNLKDSVMCRFFPEIRHMVDLPPILRIMTSSLPGYNKTEEVFTLCRYIEKAISKLIDKKSSNQPII